MAAIITTILGLGTLAPYIVLRSKRKLLHGIFLKIATSVLFLLTTLTAAFGHATYEPLFLNRWLVFGVIAGQILGLLGDYWLDMKDMMHEHNDVYQFAGFSSFFVGHLFFIGGMFVTYKLKPIALLIALGVGAALSVFVLLTEKPMKLVYGKFKGITVAYTCIFGAVIAVAVQGYLAAKGTQPLVMAIGLFVFLLSDLVLSGTYFGEGKERPIDYALNYLFYYGGQFIIALSLLWL